MIMAKEKFKVVGPGRVMGVEPGGEVEIDRDEPNGLNVDALVEAGALEATKSSTKSTDKTDSGKDAPKTEGK
jgi:hypothetical protein